MSGILHTSEQTLGRCMCIITGASKGFGRALAHLVLYNLKPGSGLLLVARSRPLLQELKEELLQSLEGMQNLTIDYTAVDLSTKEGVENIVDMAKQMSLKELDHVLLVNNAASLGDISPFESFTELNRVNAYLALNISSVLALTAGVLQAFPPRARLRWSVVNCSSTFALQARPSWVLYCTAKAAREMMFRVLAVENPKVKVLSYSPGPMDTEMQRDIQRLTGIQYHLHPCRESATKLMRVLLDNDFATGSHLDFFEL
ncbi:sepiapterin reductase b [Corythoichthys intestinalis]|uniref:sepiapterin reductase b n=1 Tax=Corythoichthys intestinalis TaxID=161448 RepID=UPI0025A63363|nr:sepiapterin reductase b [Corythoichthys intestinalis]XP_061804531.1 sepiapterin reductase-like [Nerophis lumbriciformis]